MILPFFHNSIQPSVILMKLVRTLLVISFLVLEIWAWGDVIYYPEFIKYMGGIRNYDKKIPVSHQEDLISIGDQKRSLFFSIFDLRKAQDRNERLMSGRKRMLKWMKRSFCTSQLRRRWVAILI